jgi:N6-L-threonylcarbamoyladenine synthase
LPLVGVNHVYAHAYAAALNAPPIEYPAVALICSGGHTALYRCSSPTEMELLGTTIDDAAGEAFDKVASILRLGFPGGPAVDRAAREGNPQAVQFPRTLLSGQSLDFSFSGIKTAVLYHVNGVPHRPRKNKPVETQTPASAPQAKGVENLTPRQIADIAASFQAAVVDVLRIKVRRAVKLTGARTIVIGGGVSANKALRAAMAELAAKLHCTLRLPEMRFCVDNAAMIAGLGYHNLLAGKISELDLEAYPTVRR